MHKNYAVNLKDYIEVNSAPTDLFSGSRCFLCFGHCNRETVCGACLGDLAFNTKACPACAKPDTSAKLCADCLSQRGVYINNTWALFRYHYPVNHLIQHMKFKQGIDIAKHLGGLLGKLLSGKNTVLPDCIMPVPLHSGRLIARGYNQSVELARPLSKQIGVNLDTYSCKRVRATAPQTDLPAKKRKGNVRNAFSITKTINYNHVLLVDDVITTGSTVNELARILSLTGVDRIDVLAVSRAG